MKITWGGHATTLINIGGHTILTDPNLTTRMFWIRRRSKPGLTDADLQTVSHTVLSHAHLDHIDNATMRRIPRSAHAIARGRITDIPKAHGFPTTSLQTWDSFTQGNLTITCVPVKHMSGRWMIDMWKYKAASFVIECEGKTIYFAGDTAYGPHFKEIAERFPNIDVAILPIGAYEPNWIMRPTHMNPQESLQAFLDLQAQTFFPIHWGTFKLSSEPFDAPPHVLMAAAEAAGVADKIYVVLPGESIEHN